MKICGFYRKGPALFKVLALIPKSDSEANEPVIIKACKLCIGL